jgi:hypothetical protein
MLKYCGETRNTTNMSFKGFHKTNLTMRFKAFFLSAVLTSGFVIPSCDPCDHDPVPNYFDIEGISLVNREGVTSSSNLPIKDSSSVNFENYWFTMDFGVSYFFGQASEPNSSFQLNMMGSALACRYPDKGYQGAQEKIESLTITTLNDFDDTHLAGSNINDLLNIFDINSGMQDLDDYLGKNISYIKNVRMLFELKEKPTISSFFKAKVVLKLDNGEEYTAENVEIELR